MNNLQGIAEKFDQAVALTNIEVTSEQKQKLLQFLGLLDKWNKAYNLTSVRDPEKMLYTHILDSIAIAPFLREDSYIDVGTGPGLPGIPLAIMCPEKSFVLLDSLGKRVRFMTQVKHELQLSNIAPVQSRVQDFQPEKPFDGVLSRAFASLKDMLHWCSHLVDSDGKFLALKGQYPHEEIAQLSTDYTIETELRVQVPGLDAERHLITLKRQS
ncbi:MAG: 16S rRNA (guanine(527)-N(7))-methyltransferase RsmG [Aestuariibacter sp.]